MKIQNDRTKTNKEALDNPQPGDYWEEHFSPYFLVVAAKGNRITVLSCLGGGMSSTRKHEQCAKVELKDGWTLDISKYMIVDKEWIKNAVCYKNIDGFVADVHRGSETMMSIVDDWRDMRRAELKIQLEELE